MMRKRLLAICIRAWPVVDLVRVAMASKGVAGVVVRVRIVRVGV